MKIIVFVGLISALFVDCRHVHHKSHAKHPKEDKAIKREDIRPLEGKKHSDFGPFAPPPVGMGQMQPGAGLPSANPYSCCQSASPPPCCNGMQSPGQQPGMIPPPPGMPQPFPGMVQAINQPMYMNQAVQPMHPGAYQVPQAPQAGCCQSPYPIQHPVNTASHFITLQGCCTSGQPTDQASPQNTNNCCLQQNAPPCCLHLRMKSGEEKNVTVNSHGTNYLLNVKLLNVNNSGSPTPPMSPTNQSTSGSSSSPTPSHPPGSSPGPSSGPTSPSSSSAGPTPTSSPNSNDCQTKGLAQHNAKRSIHNSPAMTLDSDLNNAAQAYADKLAQAKAVKHSANADRPGQGENLAMKCSNPDKGFDCGNAVDMWYKEVNNYDFGSPGYKSSTGHFTQLVWKASTKLGLGKASYQNNGMTCWVIVGRYKEAGNVAGKFPENVERGSFTGSA